MATLLAALSVGLGACSGGGSGGDSGGSAADSSVVGAPARVEAGGGQSLPDAASAPADGTGAGGSGAGKGALNDVAPQQAAVISTGDVQLQADDVAKAVFDVHKVVDLYHGTVQEDATETDQHGRPVRSRMVVRVPSRTFDNAVTDLGKVGTLLASSSSSKDVTTDVLDNRVRVQVAKRSINRISQLLDQADTIAEVISIESQLSQRQADLASLEQQERYLADQTSMSTITVSIERTAPKPAPVTHRHHHHGFVAGLTAGWRGLRSFGVAVATVTGALLPWLVLLLVLAVPGWPLLRWTQRRGRARRGEAAAA